MNSAQLKVRDLEDLNDEACVRATLRAPLEFEARELGNDQHEFVIATTGLKRDRAVVELDGLDTTKYMKNPVVMFAHDYRSFPVGMTTQLIKERDHIRARVKYAPTAQAQEVKTLVELGFLRGASIAWWPVETVPIRNDQNEVTGWRYVKSDLLEWSIVPVPLDPDAVRPRSLSEILEESARARGVSVPKVSVLLKLEEEESRAVPRAENLKKMPEDRPWDGPAAVRRLREWAGGPDKEKINWRKYARGFAWVNSDAPEEFGSYKLPHHDVVDGELVTVWRGVAAAMAALLGARGGVEIPEGERRSVYNHLRVHYRQFEKEPPEFREALSDEAVLASTTGTGSSVVTTELVPSTRTSEEGTASVAVTTLSIEAEEVLARPGIEETENEYRVRVRDPGDFQEDSFRRITLKRTRPRIFGIVGRLKGKETMTLQALRFPKADGWTRPRVEAWVKSHPEVFRSILIAWDGDDEESPVLKLSRGMDRLLVTAEEADGDVTEVVSVGSVELTDEVLSLFTERRPALRVVRDPLEPHINLEQLRRILSEVLKDHLHRVFGITFKSQEGRQ